MITATLNQRICKRQRRLAVAFKESLQELQSSEKPLLPVELQAEPEQTNQPKREKWFLGRYGLLSLLVLCSSLFLLAFKADKWLLPPPGYTDLVIQLEPDPQFEEMLFNHLISADVRLADDVPEGSDDLEIPGGMEVSRHIVKKGESIGIIAKRYQLNMDTIISFNNIQNARTLRAGLELAIPSINGIKYRVKRGDSLSGIANRFRISLNNLLDWNNIVSSVIFPGTEYFIPGARLNKNDLNRALGILFVYPVKGRLTSRFGWRKDPIAGHRSFHNGIDLAGPTNTVIKAAMDGQVVKTSYAEVYGRYIIIKHTDGFQTLYGHLNKYAVKEKQWVEQGQKVGYMGNTGYSTGTHLHFAIFKNGEPIDPFKYLD